MNVGDVVGRADALLKKYEKYTVEDDKKDKEKSNDRFMDAYTEMVDRVNELNLKSEGISQEKNRAVKAAQNAELRREKGLLLTEELPKLEKLVKKGKKVRQVKEGIEAVPDGVHTQRKPYGRMVADVGKGKGKQEIIIDATQRDMRMDNDANYYTHTDATKQFRQARKLGTAEWEDAKRKQDKALDSIEKGIGTLKGIGEAMGESLNQQDIVLDTIDEKMNKVTEQLKTNNMKLKGVLTQMRSSRNFCLDVVLICIILGLGLYLFELFKKK
ncbi:Syntaxin-71 [Coccomyxa sp. Obi]|nr:Syntaxin-71 [Coccomyxa sp. Obi]